jgi:hypothetical protein
LPSTLRQRKPLLRLSDPFRSQNSQSLDILGATQLEGRSQGRFGSLWVPLIDC